MWKLEFSKPDKYNQVHAKLKLDRIQKSLDANSTIPITIGPKEYKYTFSYEDAGRVGYARAEGGQAIGGRITNRSLDWGKPGEIKKENYPIINFSGFIERRENSMALLFFMDWK